MEAPMNALLSTAIALTPFLVVIALLRFADFVSARREASIARQIALTDAIHRELGAVAAPVVSRRPGGGWLVSMAVPLDRPGTTAAIVRITERMFAPDGRGVDALRILLTPAAARPVTGASAGPSGRRVGSAASALPALS
jgi:uncharacterized RDD family membrane protein YckC